MNSKRKMDQLWSTDSLRFRGVNSGITYADLHNQNRRRSYRAQQRAAAKRRNIAKRGGAK